MWKLNRTMTCEHIYRSPPNHTHYLNAELLSLNIRDVDWSPL